VQWQIPRKKTCFDAGKIGFCHCAFVLQAQVPKLCTDLDLSLLYILILGIYSKFARKINFLALGVYCPPGQSAFRRSRPQLKLGEEIDSSRLVDDYACKNQRYQTPPQGGFFFLKKKRCRPTQDITSQVPYGNRSENLQTHKLT